MFLCLFIWALLSHKDRLKGMEVFHGSRKVVKILGETWILFILRIFVCVGYKDVEDTIPVLTDSTVYSEGTEGTQKSPLGSDK